MPRVKRGTTAHKRRKKILKLAKGYRGGRKSKYKLAKEAFLHAQTYAYRDRRNKKRDFRRLWEIKINAGARKEGITYSKFINALTKNKILINRKLLADLAENEPETFKKLIEMVK